MACLGKIQAARGRSARSPRRNSDLGGVPGGVDRWPVARLGNLEARLACRLKPAFDRLGRILDCFGTCVSVRHAAAEVRDIGNPEVVLVRPEQIDVVMRLVHDPICRPYSSTNSSKRRTW